eukprot:5094844-Pyramimonas_sp.AAC.1
MHLEGARSAAYNRLRHGKGALLQADDHHRRVDHTSNCARTTRQSWPTSQARSRHGPLAQRGRSS